MAQGIIRLVALLVWAGTVLFVGGIAVRNGAGQALVGGLELLVILAGVVGIIATPLWARSIGRSRERAASRY